MCGIVGYIGNKRDARDVLLGGLKRLEYRGYDSAGIATIGESSKVEHVRAVGYVAKLEKKLNATGACQARTGIAHTRWATHGKPSLKNAHPHKAGDIYLVHNGIIENYQPLREKLTKLGVKFSGDTDSEILAHLIDLEYKNSENLSTAVRRALMHVRGAYAIVAMSPSEPDVLVAACLSSPLVIGVGDGEYILASDAVAIVPYTKRVIYLGDKEIAEVTATSHRITTLKNKKRHKKECELEFGLEDAKLAGYPHFMLKEIFEQPHSIADSMRGRLLKENGNVILGGLGSIYNELKDMERLIIVSCGTARCAALAGGYMLEDVAGIPVEVDYAHEFRYRNAPIGKNTVVLAISQSGETADTLAALKVAKKKGALTLGIINTVGSSITRETDAGVYNHAGPEVAVASTKAYTSQLTILALITVLLSRQRKMSVEAGKRIIKELCKMPKLMEEILGEYPTSHKVTKGEARNIQKIAKKYAKYDNFFFLGRKYNYATALEGAIKLKELSYIHAEGDTAGELKHGPIAMIDKNFPTIFIVPKDSTYEKTLNAMEEVRARCGKVIAITTKGCSEVEKIANDVIYIPKTLEMLTPILAVVPLQLFAYYFAVARGRNVDRPRNLAKSVTVE